MQARGVLITGATGFVGSALCPSLSESGWYPVATCRSPGASADGYELRYVDEIGPDTSWAGVLEQVEAVVHLHRLELDDAAARAAARAVVSSDLLKAAVHGADPNWGRIAMAVGNAVVAPAAVLEAAGLGAVLGRSR